MSHPSGEKTRDHCPAFGVSSGYCQFCLAILALVSCASVVDGCCSPEVELLLLQESDVLRHRDTFEYRVLGARA